MSASLSRLARALVLVAGLGAMAAPAASAANTVGISYTDGAGLGDPVPGLPRTETVSGSSDADQLLFIKGRPAGTGDCAATPAGDVGKPLGSTSDGRIGFFSAGASVIYGSSIDAGPFRFVTGGTFAGDAGTYLYCVWFAPSETTITTPISGTVTFRPRRGDFAMSLGAAQVRPTAMQTLSITGTAEGTASIRGKIRAAGGPPCAATMAQDPGERLSFSSIATGAFSASDRFRREQPGEYLVCVWLEADGVAIAGPRSATYAVVAPPPPPRPCIVPALAPNTPLAALPAALTAAGCTVGPQRLAAHASVPRGSVIALEPAAGTRLATNAAVTVVVSDGRPCIVPRIRRGAKLSTVRAQVTAAGCTYRVVRRRDSVRRGRVAKLAAHTGARLAPRATVPIVVSKGRARRR